MKTIQKLTFAALGLSLSFAACTDDEPAIPGQVIQRGDSACRIETFTLKLSDGAEIKGDVYDYDKSIDISYTTDQLDLMQSASAVAVLSEGATITPNPATAADYTAPVTFTVTAKDGTKRTYTTNSVEKVVVTYAKASKLIEKGAADLGVGNSADYYSIGVSGENIVIGTKVFNGKTLAPVGDLNMTGITGKIVWQTNDEAGHLVASVTEDGGRSSTPASIYIWKDGYSATPELLLGPSDSAIAGFVSVGGDLTSGTALVTAAGGNGATGPHFCWEFVDGERSGNYYPLTTGLPTGSNPDGWSQMVSPCTGNVAGQWFVWDAPGDNAIGHVVMTWNGWNGTGTPSNMVMISGIVSANGGSNGWGNLRVASLRSFVFNEIPYAAIVTFGWQSTYTSIVSAESEFLLNPNDTFYEASHNGSEPAPAAAYVLNKSDNCGYVYSFEATQKLAVYKLEIAVE